MTVPPQAKTRILLNVSGVGSCSPHTVHKGLLQIFCTTFFIFDLFPLRGIRQCNITFYCSHNLAALRLFYSIFSLCSKLRSAKVLKALPSSALFSQSIGNHLRCVAVNSKPPQLDVLYTCSSPTHVASLRTDRHSYCPDADRVVMSARRTMYSRTSNLHTVSSARTPQRILSCTSTALRTFVLCVRATITAYV